MPLPDAAHDPMMPEDLAAVAEDMQSRYVRVTRASSIPARAGLWEMWVPALVPRTNGIGCDTSSWRARAVAFRRGEGLEAHDVFLWPLKLVFYAWLTLALMALAAMGMEIVLPSRSGDAAALAQAQQTLNQDIELTHSLRPEAPLTRLAVACARGCMASSSSSSPSSAG